MPEQQPNAATRALPAWLGGGAVVSAKTYDVVVERFAASQRGETLEIEDVANRLGLDEADVLRSLAELRDKGVMV